MSYPLLHLSQTHPFFGGLGQGLQLAQEGINAYHLPKTLREKLKKMQMENELYPETMRAQNRSKNAYADLIGQQSNWYGPKAQADIAYQGMQGQHLGAQNALLGEQTNELGAENSRKKRILDIYREMANSQQDMPQQDNYNPSQTSLGEMQQKPGQDLLPEPSNEEYSNQGMQLRNNLNQIPIANNSPLPMTGPQAKKLSQLQSELGMLQGMPMKGKAGLETPEQKREGSLNLDRQKQDIRAYEKINEGASARAASSADAITQLEILKEASSKLKSAERGPYIGKAPAFSENAQVYDKTSAALQKAVMDGMKGQGQMSKAKMEFIERIKPNRSMNKAASERIGDTLQAMAERSLEEQPFYTLAEKKGLNHKEAQALWALYNKERPEYDAKKEAPIKGNLNQYNEYLNANALESALKGKPYDPKGVQNKFIFLKEVKENNTSNISYDEAKIAHTAKKYNMSIEQVKEKLGIK